MSDAAGDEFDVEQLAGLGLTFDFDSTPPPAAPPPPLQRGNGGPPDNYFGATTQMPMPTPPSAVNQSGAITDLRSWMAQFGYQPEMGYVRLERVAPAHHEGMAATGMLEEMYQITDESYIRRTWGGGTYKVYAYQPHQGTPTFAAQGHLTIAGVPLAFPGPTGKPINFPTSAVAAASPYALAGNRDAVEAAVAPHPAPTYGPHGMMDPGVMGLLDRLEGQSNNRQTNEMLEQVRGYYSEEAERQASLMKSAGEGQKELYGQLLQMQGAGQAPLQEALSAARQQVEALRNDYNERMRLLDERNRHQIEQMSSAHQQSIELLQKEHDSAMGAVNGSAATTVDNMRSDRQRDVDTMRETQRTEISQLRREADQARDNFGTRERDIREANQRAIDEMRTRLEDRAKSAEAAADRGRTEHIGEVGRMRSEAGERELQIRTEATARVEQLRRDLSEQHGSTRESAISTYESQLTMLRDQLESERIRSQDRIDNERNTSKSVYEPRIDLMNTQINDLRSELVNVRAEAANASARANEKSDPIAQLQQVAHLQSTVTGLFGGPAQAGPAEPAHWLGKLAAFGPQIAEHVVKPVVGPIADAVNLAREESAHRREWLERQEANQATAQADARARGVAQGPVVMRQPMVRPQMAPPEQYQQPPPQEYYQGHQQPVPQPQPAQESMFEPGPVLNVPSRQPQPAPAETSPADLGLSIPGDVPAPTQPPEQREEFVSPVNAAVLTYLNDAYMAGKSAAALVEELRGLQSMGIISDDDLKSITGSSEDDVINAVGDAATAAGMHDLTTPDAQVYLSNIYNALT